MAIYKDMEFNSISKEKFDKIMNELITFLKKSNVKHTYTYTSRFTRFLKYLDKNNIMFDNISKTDISNYIKIEKKINNIKKVINFLIKSGYISRDNFNKYNENKNFRLDNYLPNFLNHLKTLSIKDSTILLRKIAIEKLMKFLISKNKEYIKNITSDILEEYIFNLFNSKVEKTNKKLSSGYLVTNIVGIKQYFNFLLKNKYINYNPSITLKYPKVEKKISENYFSQNEIKEFFNQIEIKDYFTYRTKLFMELLYNLGLRISECRNLKLSDIDFENKIIRIRISKTSEGRNVVMNNYIIEYLKLYIENIHNKYFKNEENYLFFNKIKRKIVTIDYIKQTLQEVTKKMKLNKKISSHAFRKSIGKHMLEKGLNIRYVQRFLGHKLIDTTTKYTILNLEDLKKAIEKYHPREIEKEKYLDKIKYRKGN